MKTSTILIILFSLLILQQVHCMENTTKRHIPNPVSLLPISSVANMLIWEATELTPLELNQFRLESRGINRDIRKLFNQKCYREKYPHYCWFYDEDMAQYFPRVKADNKTIQQMIKKYRYSLEKIIFDERLCDADKLLKLNELNELFFYDSKLVLSLKDKIKFKERVDAKLSMILQLHYMWINVLNDVAEDVWASVRDNLRGDLGGNVLEKDFENVWDNVWDNVKANVFENIRDEVRDHVRSNVINNIRLKVRANIGANVKDNTKNLVQYNLGQIDFSSELWDEGHTMAFRLLVLYAFSEYLYGSILYLEEKKTSDKLDIANLNVFEKYQFIAEKDMLSKIVKPCSNYLNFHKASIGLDDKFKKLLAREFYEDEKLSDYSFNPLIGVICNILSEEEELVDFARKDF